MDKLNYDDERELAHKQYNSLVELMTDFNDAQPVSLCGIHQELRLIRMLMEEKRTK